jgi:hypothetical protein
VFLTKNSSLAVTSAVVQKKINKPAIAKKPSRISKSPNRILNTSNNNLNTSSNNIHINTMQNTKPKLNHDCKDLLLNISHQSQKNDLINNNKKAAVVADGLERINVNNFLNKIKTNKSSSKVNNGDKQNSNIFCKSPIN